MWIGGLADEEKEEECGARRQDSEEEVEENSEWKKKERSGRKEKKAKEYEWKINREKTEMEDDVGVEWRARGATLSHPNQWGPGCWEGLFTAGSC